jgi:hypothetical protein
MALADSIAARRTHERRLVRMVVFAAIGFPLAIIIGWLGGRHSDATHAEACARVGLKTFSSHGRNICVDDNGVLHARPE